MKQTLKTMAILLCAVAMVMMTSCSKETSYQNRIVGKWKLTKLTWHGDVYTGPSSAFDDRWEPIEFKSNGMCTFGVRFLPKSNSEIGGQYSIENDEITILAGYSKFSWKILELTNSSLVCQEYYPYFQDGDGSKFEFTKVN